MKLYYHPASTTCRMIMLFAAQQGIELEFQTVDLMTGEHLKPEYKAVNPSCLVPALLDGEFCLTESGAIIRYLAGKYPSAAYPADLQQRARVDEAMEWFYSNFYKDFGYGMIYPQLFPHHQRPTPESQAQTIAWGKQKAQHWLGILDRDLLGNERRYLCGNTVTLADYVGIEMVTLGELVRCTFQDYPNVRRWIASMKALPHWAAVHAVAEGFAASLKDREFVAI
jgi:glutathione S-transferase